MFETELAFFEKNRSEWLKTVRGKFALIKGEECFGFYDTDEEAFNRGVEQIGAPPFLIKLVDDENEVYSNPAYEIGLIYVNI